MAGEGGGKGIQTAPFPADSFIRGYTLHDSHFLRVWTPLWMQAILNSGLACRVGADVYSASKCGFVLPRAFMGMR